MYWSQVGSFEIWDPENEIWDSRFEIRDSIVKVTNQIMNRYYYYIHIFSIFLVKSVVQAIGAKVHMYWIIESLKNFSTHIYMIVKNGYVYYVHQILKSWILRQGFRLAIHDAWKLSFQYVRINQCVTNLLFVLAFKVLTLVLNFAENQLTFGNIVFIPR